MHVIHFPNLTLCKSMAQLSCIGENYYLLLLIFFLLPLLYFILKQFKSNASTKNTLPFPPGPKPWPLLGNIAHMGKMPHVTLTNFARIHGPLIMLRLGTQNMVVASSPEAAMEILKTHDRLLSARYLPKSLPSNPEELNKCSIGWAETCNDGWKFLRTLCRGELFSVKTLDAQSCLRERKIVEMIEHINEGEVVNIGELVFATAFNMLSNVLLSNDLIDLDEKIEDGGMKGLIWKLFQNTGAKNISDLYPILSRFDPQGIRKNSKETRKKIECIYEPIIEERRRKTSKVPSTSRPDFLDILLQNKFTNARIHQLFIELFTAGTDTTTSTVEWAMAELIKSPETMKKVIQELDRELGQDDVVLTESHLTRLVYLHACVKETLRLHPPAPMLLPRRAPVTCQVMNYTIPKNAIVYINIWSMGHDLAIWEEPLMFKPERFLNCGVDFKGNDFEFVPFGGGRRICPGLPMAGRKVAFILAALLNSFDWNLPKGKKLDMKEKFGITLQKQEPLILIPTLRK